MCLYHHQKEHKKLTLKRNNLQKRLLYTDFIAKNVAIEFVIFTNVLMMSAKNVRRLPKINGYSKGVGGIVSTPRLCLGGVRLSENAL